MLDPEADPGYPPSVPSRKGPSFSGASRNTGPLPGSRTAARKRKGLLRRSGIIVPATGIAAFVVAIVFIASYMMSSNGNSAGAFGGALNALTHSNSVTALEAERQQLIVMNAAAQTLSQGSKPANVNPQQIIASASASAAAANNASSGGGSSSSGGSTTVNVPVAAAPDPGSAEAIAQQLMPSYGFSVSGQYSCLYDLWMRESGWRYDAYNPSGAYGIPQSLPGDKMASAGSDWQTNPATQIKWGLGYISQIYGTPCGAWDHEVADGWY
jgi:hypothetical protein